MSGRWRLAADVGGTFTDLVVIAPDGRSTIAKVPSTPDDYAVGITAGLAKLLAEEGVSAASIGGCAHGTTVVTNAILERKGAPTALITTRGFRDVLEIGRMRMPRLYDLNWVKPVPLVERDRRHEVTERRDAKGRCVTALDESEVIEALRAIVDQGIGSLAVCFLHSYADGVHERRVAELAAEHAPGLDVSLSSDVLPEAMEYERTSTTVVNAYVRPVVRDYFASLVDELAHHGVTAPVTVMQSDGGLMAIEAATRRPVNIVESGPAAGVVAARALALAHGYDNALSFDMGGTTAKACLIDQGRVATASEYAVGAELSAGSRVFKGSGYSVRAPALDIAEVGAGGGSILWIDPGGLLHVGPHSAGAEPGPVAYRRGGTDPTLTDANIVLGYIASLAGGAVPVDPELAWRHLDERIARPLGLSVEDAAHGARRVAISTMARALRAVSTERGRDPRQFVLIAFGGNGPGHATELAEELEVPLVLVPAGAGVFSAVGLGEATSHRTMSRTVHAVWSAGSEAALEAAFAVVERQLEEEMANERGAGERIVLERGVDLRYTGQLAELTITVDGQATIGAQVERIAGQFADEHRRLYGYVSDHPVEVVNVRVTGSIEVDTTRPALRLDRREPASEPGEAVTRKAYFGRRHGWLTADVFAGFAPLATARRGPCIVETYDSTMVVTPGWTAQLDGNGAVVIEREERRQW